LEFRAEGLAFSIMFAPCDGENWMWCNAIIDVPGFRGDLDFQMLIDDLEQFRRKLADSLDEVNWPCDVRLVSTDPGIDLSFRIDHTGQTEGKYRFGGCGSYHPVLSGTFRMDQTYLVPLLAQVDQLIADLA
jgi:hypothetical protein